MRKEGKALSAALGRKKGTWKEVDAGQDGDSDQDDIRDSEPKGSKGLDNEEGVEDVDCVESPPMVGVE